MSKMNISGSWFFPHIHCSLLLGRRRTRQAPAKRPAVNRSATVSGQDRLPPLHKSLKQ